MGLSFIRASNNNIKKTYIIALYALYPAKLYNINLDSPRGCLNVCIFLSVHYDSQANHDRICLFSLPDLFYRYFCIA